ncbi:MAG: hypothetical protein Q9159_007169 [Coniocarpon cinnabarinum]
MRLISALLVTLPALTVAAEQNPLFDTAKSYLDKARDYFSYTQSPFDAGAAKVAERETARLTWTYWRETLQHSGEQKPYNPPEAWMVYFTGNKTCHGLCHRSDLAWNESVALFTPDVSAPHLATVNCDLEPLLCGSWAAATGSIWFILLPQPLPDQSPAATDITIHTLNLTTVTNADITHIHTRKEYLKTPRYEGPLHPFDGWVQKTGLVYPMAYGLWTLSKIPNWAFMVGMSFISRRFM